MLVVRPYLAMLSDEELKDLVIFKLFRVRLLSRPFATRTCILTPTLRRAGNTSSRKSFFVAFNLAFPRVAIEIAVTSL